MPPLSHSKKDSALYGPHKPGKLKGAAISSSNSLTFTSQLSSLISDSATRSSKSNSGRLRIKKDDIFSLHNKNIKKRALKDIDDSHLSQEHSTSSEVVDEATWHRAKRKMEEKARLYAAMKRGDVEDENDLYAVDFDRKWAESQEHGVVDQQTSDDENVNDSGEEQVEYIDEFGRTRQGSRAQAARMERINRGAALADEPDRFSARPSMPADIIYGATIQTHAFNPDEPIAAQMADLAAKRDKAQTPPPDEHFDGRKEIRTKGVGFFQFSADNEQRARQFAELERERAETERCRVDVRKRKEARMDQLQAKRKAISKKRSEAEAERFLNDLADEFKFAANSSVADTDAAIMRPD